MSPARSGAADQPVAIDARRAEERLGLDATGDREVAANALARRDQLEPLALADARGALAGRLAVDLQREPAAGGADDDVAAAR